MKNFITFYWKHNATSVLSNLKKTTDKTYIMIFISENVLQKLDIQLFFVKVSSQGWYCIKMSLLPSNLTLPTYYEQ